MSGFQVGADDAADLSDRVVHVAGVVHAFFADIVPQKFDLVVFAGSGDEVDAV